MPSPFYVQPASNKGLLRGIESGVTSMIDSQLEKAAEEKKQAKLDEASQIYQSGTPEEIGMYLLKNPEITESFKQAEGVKKTLTDEEDTRNAWDIVTGKATAEQLGIERAEVIQQRGGDAAESIAMTEDAMRGGDMAMKVAYATLAKNDSAGLKAYLATQGEGEDEELTIAQKDFNSLTENLRPADVLLAQRISLGLDPRAVGSAVQTITEKGTAEEIADTEAVIAERRKFAEMTGSSRSRAIDKGFDKVQKLSKNISNLDDAIEAVRAGAGTGAITKRFPSIKGSSVLLDQVQGSLALDVIGSVTFGALSEGELQLAKQIAIPTGLEGPELITWLEDRKSAQTKLLGYFQDQIDFLDQGGSVAGFLRSKGRSTPTGNQLPEGVTEEDISFTMKTRGMTREQVLDKLGAK